MGHCIWAYTASAQHIIAADTISTVDGPHRDLSRCVGSVGPPKTPSLPYRQMLDVYVQEKGLFDRTEASFSVK